jgi:type I restriction enzyme, R subunit
VIPDVEYQTKDFERVISLEARTEAIARHLTDFLKKTDRYAKTIVFCVDQEHADLMRRALNNLNADIVKQLPAGEQYVARVTSDEANIGRGFLGKFQDPEERLPVILTTSQLLTTGVDAPTCQNVVLIRVIGSMTEFKQIIGRGTRVREDKGKLFFNIIDYTGSATRLFADPDFDGEPALATTEEIDEQGQVIEDSEKVEEEQAIPEEAAELEFEEEANLPRKLYAHGGQAQIHLEVTCDLNTDGSKLRTVQLTQFTADTIRTLYTDPDDLRKKWSDFEQRSALMAMLEERGIDFTELAAKAGHPEADPFDLLCHLAYNAPLLTRKERAEKLRRNKQDFFDQFGPEAKAILNALLDKYAVHGTAQFSIPDVLEVPPISEHGNVVEIAGKFGGADKLMEAVGKLQEFLYAA